MLRLMWIPCLVMAVVIGCGESSSEGARDVQAITEALNEEGFTSDVVTIEGVDFPPVVSETSPEVLEAYIFAAKHPEVLTYMPCFCGCQKDVSPPHQSNYDCFIDAIDRTGPRPRVDIDRMGFG